MQTVNFRCDHCGNLMAVAAAHLGQQVRCPHCRQVVTAPTAAAPPPPLVPPAPSPAEQPPAPAPPWEPTFTVPEAVAEPDSIFAPPDADEDLFGGSAKPRLEIPQEPVWPQVPAQTSEALQSASGTPFDAAPAPAAVAETVTWLGEVPPAPAPEAAATALLTDEESQEEGSNVLAGVARPVREIKHTAGGNPWILPLVILPLISYSVLVTILLAMAYSRPAPPHPLEMQRDDDGSNPPARKTGKERVRRSYKWNGRQFLDLPEKQRVALGSSLTVGDLKVTPLAAELRPIHIYTEGYPEPDPSPHPTLVLHLELENVSSDVAFCPLDPYFDRRFQEQFVENAPFTFLEKGEKRFYGGAAAFGTRSRDNPVRAEALELHGLDGDPDRKLPQYVKKELMPGEKLRSFVACNAESKDVAEALAGYDGPLVYRVRLRRGLVPFQGQDVSASTVIGVEFSGKDVKRPG